MWERVVIIYIKMAVICLLMVVGLSVLKGCCYKSTDREQTESTDGHGTRARADEAV